MKHGFTIVELLVVVTIIVVLLALLAPALDKAIYQGELAVCAANLKGIATGSTLYAMDNKRHYFHRAGVFDMNADWRPHWLARPGNSITGQRMDDRPVLRNHINLQMFSDPLAGKLRLSEEETHFDSLLEPPVALWAGFKYSGQKGMLRLGDQVNFAGIPYPVIATDMDVASGPRGSGATQYSGHPDRDRNILRNTVIQDGNGPTDPTGTQILQWVLARWQGGGGVPARGNCDYNFALTDGSVKRVTDVMEGDPRMSVVPLWVDANVGGWRWNIPGT